jgi:hypothetical protein
MRTAIRLLLPTLLLLAACGCARYGFGGGQAELPDDVRTLDVREVENPTMETGLPAELMASFRDEITRREGLSWAPRERADGLVDLEIERYSVTSSVVGERQETLQFSANVRLNAEIVRRADGKRLWNGTAAYAQTFQAVGEEDARRRAVDLAVRRLVDKLTDAY